MTGATFVHCPGCGRLMLGQRHGADIYPQPHDCCLCAHVPSIPGAPDVSCPRCTTSHHPRNDETTESEGNR